MWSRGRESRSVGSRGGGGLGVVRSRIGGGLGVMGSKEWQ